MSNSSVTMIDLSHLGGAAVGALRPSLLAKGLDPQETVTRGRVGSGTDWSFDQDPTLPRERAILSICRYAATRVQIRNPKNYQTRSCCYG